MRQQYEVTLEFPDTGKLKTFLVMALSFEHARQLAKAKSRNSETRVINYRKTGA